MDMNNLEDFFTNSNSQPEKAQNEPSVTPANLEPRCPIILLLDTSGSMTGEPIEELNAGISILKEEVDLDPIAQKRVEVGLITFGGQVEVVQDLVTIDNFRPITLKAEGNSVTGEAIEKAIALLENRQNEYTEKSLSYYRPWIFLISDGEPTDKWEHTAQKLQQAQQNNQLVFFAVGVNDADMNILEKIGNKQALKLKGLKFQELFKWLSNSLLKISNSIIGDEVALPEVEVWGEVPITR